MMLVTCFVTAFSSCTLDVQDNFDFKGDVFINEDPFENMTAWEFIQTRRSSAIRDSQGRFRLVSNRAVLGATGDELDFMTAAIKKVGFESLYNQTATTGRTYLLLNNNCFTGNTERDIIRSIRGAQLADNSTVNPDNYFDNWTPEQLNQLKAILKYHIVTDYVAQIPTIPTFGVNILFKTLLPKVDTDVAVPVLKTEMSDIAFYRNPDSRTTLVINDVTSPLPATANTLAFNENVRRHNYVFNNGIGHFLQEMVRYQPYSLYSNLTID